MNFDNQIDYILKFLIESKDGVRISHDAVTLGFPIEELPDGWVELPKTVGIVAGHFDEMTLTHFKVELGLLRFYIEDTEEVYLEIFDNVAQAVAAKSAKTCLVCGISGTRRKYEQYWPCLCNSHYLQYRNWLDKNGKLGEDAGTREVRNGD